MCFLFNLLPASNGGAFLKFLIHCGDYKEYEKHRDTHRFIVETFPTFSSQSTSSSSADMSTIFITKMKKQRIAISEKSFVVSNSRINASIAPDITLSQTILLAIIAVIVAVTIIGIERMIFVFLNNHFLPRFFQKKLL